MRFLAVEKKDKMEMEELYLLMFFDDFVPVVEKLVW